MTQTLKPSDAVKRYAKHLESQSFAIDESSWPSKALHIRSNTERAMETFQFGFTAWAKAEGIRVEVDNYGAFLGSLTNRLGSLLPRITQTAFRPVPQQIFVSTLGVPCANSYVAYTPTVPPKFEMPSMLEEYLSRVFANAQDRKMVVQWLADIVQNPCRRPQWCVLLTGEQGTGKSTVSRLVSLALGRRYVWESNQYTPAFARFSEVFADNLLTVFDDAPADGRNTYTSLKQAITRTSQTVEIKGQQRPVSREVYSRILILSNNTRPLRLEEGDRRVYAAEYATHRTSPEETAEFFTAFNNWLDCPGSQEVIYHWLSTVDLSDFNPSATVKTETHRHMVDLSISDLEATLKGLLEIEEGEDPVVFTKTQLARLLEDKGFKSINSDQLRMKMEAHGYELSRDRKIKSVNDGRKIDLWQPRPKGLRAPSLTAAQVESLSATF